MRIEFLTKVDFDYEELLANYAEDFDPNYEDEDEMEGIANELDNELANCYDVSDLEDFLFEHNVSCRVDTEQLF